MASMWFAKWSIIFIFNVLALGLVVADQNICSRPAEIVFLIDDSRSIWIVHFKQELAFVQTLVSQFDVSENTTRIAAATFSSGVKEAFSLSRYSSVDEINDAIKKIHQRNGDTTDTHTGIQYARESIFNTARPGVSRTLIIITDGESTLRNATFTEATKTINSGITIIVVGIGKMSKAQLEEIASKPTNKYLFTVDTFPKLANIESLVAQQACEASTEQGDQPTPEEDQNICSRPAEIVFLIDDSRSIWIVHFKQELAFVQTLVSQFDVSENTTRIAAATFSSGVKEAFSLSRYSSVDEINDAIKKIHQRNGDTTDTHTGIQYARESISNTARPGVSRILIIITDGESTLRNATFTEATKTINSGITIIVVGIGKMSKAQLEEIASKPTNKYLFTVDTFPKLANIESLVAQQACEASTEQGDQPTPEEECRSKPADVVFVLDVSNSVYILDFEKQLKFVSDVVDIFDIGPTKTQVATITFSTDATVEYYLNEFDNKQDIQDKTLKINHRGGITETRLALALVRDEVLTSQYGARVGVAQIVIVITDGLSQEYIKTREVAKTVKDKGIHMFAIGVGSNIDKQELIDIGSVPSEKYVFEIGGYSALDTIKEIIAFRTCEQTP